MKNRLITYIEQKMLHHLDIEQFEALYKVLEEEFNGVTVEMFNEATDNATNFSLTSSQYSKKLLCKVLNFAREFFMASPVLSFDYAAFS